MTETYQWYIQLRKHIPKKHAIICTAAIGPAAISIGPIPVIKLSLWYTYIMLIYSLHTFIKLKIFVKGANLDRRGNRIHHRQHVDSWCFGAVKRHAISGPSIVMHGRKMVNLNYNIGLILSLGPANERRRYKVTTSLIGRAQTKNQPCIIWVTENIDAHFCEAGNQQKNKQWYSLRPSEAYMRQQTKYHWLRQWLVAWLAPSHYLNQCWDIANWYPGKKLQRRMKRNS